jgi:hypothetical protein
MLFSTGVVLLTITLATLPSAADATLYPDYPGIDGQAVGATTSISALGSGAWLASGSGKSSIYLDPVSLGFVGGITVTDLDDIQWSTWRPDPGLNTPVDWYMTIYTTPDSINDDDWWYGRRLTWEGLYANNINAPDETWVQWQLADDALDNQVTMHDGNRTATGFYGGPTLAEVQAGPLDWGDYATSGSSDVVDYSTESIMYIVFETGNPWASWYTGAIDNLIITANNNSVSVDLEPSPIVPVPPAFLMGGVGFGVLALRRRLSKRT